MNRNLPRGNLAQNLEPVWRPDASPMADNSNSSAPPRFDVFHSFPTLPYLARTTGLRGGIAFLEGPSSEWTRQDLIDWFNEHIVSPGLMPLPPLIREPPLTPVSLNPTVHCRGNVPEMLARARQRVTAALRGIVAPVVDDRFLSAAIYGSRVRRAEYNGRPVWEACPREVDCLSDMVLSLFASAILIDREFYRLHLSICKKCERISFYQARERKDACADHRDEILTQEAEKPARSRRTP